MENKKILLGVANIWAARKGISDLFKLNDMLDEQYKLVLVGDLKGQSVPENVLYIPHTDSVEELAEIYTSADFFVNPTYEDNFPTTNLESLACGTPVLTYKTGGSPEAITEDCGISVEKGDVNALAEAVKTMQFSSEACLENSRKYDKNVCFDKYIKLYEELVR